MKSRRQAREAALQLMYQADTLAEVGQASIDRFFEVFFPEYLVESDNLSINFTRELAQGCFENLSAIDAYITHASEHWSMERMSRVDRNILRLGVYEIVYLPEVPFSVTINEYIEVAKRFACPESPHFINGVLDKVASAFSSGETIPPLKRRSVVNG